MSACLTSAAVGARAALCAGLLSGLLGGVGLGSTAQAQAQAKAADCETSQWPLWQDFNSHFIAADARVLSAITASRDTYSEAQSYAMFFALVANDQATFDRLWRWSLQNLAAGDLENKLPAWHWGRAPDNSWGVLDANSASDADLWFAYALLEAGRLWQRPELSADGRLLLASVVKQEVVKLPGLGAMLLPGPYGFVQADGSWRLNPSYLPLPLLRRFALESPDGPWNEIAANTVKMIKASTPKGFAPDWLTYRAPAGRKPSFGVDPVHGPNGSYDAIRVYLWAGMTANDDPLAGALLKALPGMAKRTTLDSVPPEKINVQTGTEHGTEQNSSPYGFSAALLPYLHQTAAPAISAQQAGRARSMQAASLLPARLAKATPSYYDHVLSLFGLGWIENRYRFMSNGQVQLKWQKSCIQANTN
jgi:endoglucanase